MIHLQQEKYAISQTTPAASEPVDRTALEPPAAFEASIAITTSTANRYSHIAIEDIEAS